MGTGVMALSRAPGRLWRSYTKTLSSNPVRTKIATSMVAALAGDVLAQRISRPADAKNWKNDWARTARLCLFNAGMGCLGHFYYGALDRRVGVLAPTSAPTVATKVAIDQLLFSPVCTLVFYGYKVAAEGRPREYLEELQAKLWPTLKAGWSLWPAAHVINFALVPTQHRILYANVVSVAGTYLLSRAAAGDFSTGKGGKGKPLVPKDMPTEVLFDGVSVKYD